MSELPKRILLIADDDYRHEEALAGGAITPGHLIALASTGKVVVHPTAGGAAERAFALEDALQGRSISTAYSADELVSFAICEPGDVVYAFLVNGENASIGSKLSSNGDGTLQVAAGVEIVVAISLEALNLSDSEHAPARLKVRIV